MADAECPVCRECIVMNEPRDRLLLRRTPGRSRISRGPRQMTQQPPDDDSTVTPDGRVLTSTPPSHEHYFILEAQSADWQWLIQERIFRKGKDQKLDTRDAFVRIHEVPHPIFYLSKAIWTPEEIVGLLGPGATPEAVTEATIIHLKPIGDQSAWQMPSVPYAGSA